MTGRHQGPKVRPPAGGTCRARVPRRLATGLAAVIALTLGVTACASPAGRSARGQSGVRIMLVGDSITQGSTGDYTWRYWLWSHLRASKPQVVFVGPRHDLWTSGASGIQAFVSNDEYADPAFAADRSANAHDALIGARFDTASPQIGAAVRTYHPDYLIILLGINDLAAGESPAAVADGLRHFVANARAASPSLRFDLLDVLPAASVPARKVAQFNRLAGELRQRLTTAASPIAVTAPPAGYTASVRACTDTWDGTHPNVRGEIKIAASVADTLHSAFGLGAAYPQPLPAMPAGPQPPPVLTAVAEANRVQLSWTPSLGATDYRIWRRLAGKRWGRPFPFPLAGTVTAFGDALLVAGRVYQYRIQPSKGTCTGGFSNTADVVPGRGT